MSSLFVGVASWNAYFNALMFINDQNLQPLQVVVSAGSSGSSCEERWSAG
ncbi:MAG TPA: hypothetical protein VEQ11_06220 [Chloroflexota bacterium]|nr:hypothetical protein [Chloroflexota bacterium]